MNTNKLAKINQETKYIVFGYTREIHKYFNVPIVIIHVIVLYYYDDFKFYTVKHGEDLAFPTDQIVKKEFSVPSIFAHWKSCIYGIQINDKQCNVFTVKIKWTTTSAHMGFFIGYITSTIDESIKHWNEHIADTETDPNNAKYSIGIHVYPGGGGGYEQGLYCYDKNDQSKKLSYAPSNAFKSGDIFTISFNFMDNQFTIHHNDLIAEILSLNDCKQIALAFSLYDMGDQIEIIKHTLS
eukprot:158876_1